MFGLSDKDEDNAAAEAKRQKHGGHVLEDHKDGCSIEDERPGTCYICSGGLAFCTVCHGGEAELPTECPGVTMTEDQRAAITSGHLDFTKERGWHHPALKAVNS